MYLPHDVVVPSNTVPGSRDPEQMESRGGIKGRY